MGSVFCVGVGAEVPCGNVGGVPPLGVWSCCRASAESDNINAIAITATRLLLFFTIHLRAAVDRKGFGQQPVRASVFVDSAICYGLSLAWYECTFRNRVVRTPIKSSSVDVNWRVLRLPNQTDMKKATSHPGIS